MGSASYNSFELVHESQQIVISKGQKLSIRILTKIPNTKREQPKQVFDIRVWKDGGPEGYTGFTKKGIQLPAEFLEPVIAELGLALAKLKDYVKNTSFQIKT